MIYSTGCYPAKFNEKCWKHDQRREKVLGIDYHFTWNPDYLPTILDENRDSGKIQIFNLNLLAYFSQKTLALILKWIFRSENIHISSRPSRYFPLRLQLLLLFDFEKSQRRMQCHLLGSAFPVHRSPLKFDFRKREAGHQRVFEHSAGELRRGRWLELPSAQSSILRNGLGHGQNGRLPLRQAVF